jgi:hypothetical protein
MNISLPNVNAILLLLVLIFTSCKTPTITVTPALAPFLSPTKTLPPIKTKEIPAITSLPSTLSPTETPTIIPSKTPTPISSPTLTPSLVETQTPIPTKPVLVSYSILGGDGGDEFSECLLWEYENSLVIYEDGQLIILGDHGLETTALTSDQIQQLMSQIEETGFFEVDGTGELREHDPIYEIDQSIQVGDGGSYIQITVEDRTIWIYKPIEEYVIKPISNTLEIIRSYQPSGLTQYNPDKLWLKIWRLPHPSGDIDWQIATPIAPIELWPSLLPPLNNLLYDENFGQVLFVDKQAEVIKDYYPQFPSGRVFNDLNREYYVVVCPELP